MNNKINKLENPNKNISKQFRDVVFSLSLGGLISTGTQVNADVNALDSMYLGMTNNSAISTANINGKTCYVRDDVALNQSKNTNIFTIPLYDKTKELGLSTEGEIANADYEIYDNRGRYVYFGKTDSKGQLRINKELLLSNLQFSGYDVQNLDNNNQVFTIRVKGGIIHDKNIDYCTDKYTITSKSAYSITGTLNQLNNSTISRISTLVENIINGKDNSNLTTFFTDNGLDPKNSASLGVINEAFTDTIERVKTGLEANYGLKNGNKDNVIDYNDITKFSDLQYTTLNSLTSFASYIQNGDIINIQNSVNQAKTKMNLVSVDYEKSSNDYLVTLSSYMKGNKIYYSYFSNFSSPILYGNGQQIILAEGQTIYIRENYSDTNTSGTISKLEFKNGKLNRDSKDISSLIINNPIGGTSGNTSNTNNGAQTSGGNSGNTTTNPIVNNGNGSYTNIDTNNNPTISTIDESIDIVISQIQKELSADNSSTNLQKILDEINTIEKEIDALKAKSAQNNTNKTNLQNELNQLTQKLTSLKQTLTNNYNKLDNNAKVLLEANLGTNQKQDAINSLLSGTQTQAVTVGNKTFDKLPNKAQITVSLDLLNAKATQLTRDVNSLKQILDRLQGIYNTKQKEYQDSVNAYNQYQTDKSIYQQVLQNLSNGISPLNFVLKNLNLNVGFIASRTGINSALSELNNRFNQYTYPESRNYQLDKTKKGLKDTGEKAFLSLLGHNSTISVDYGSNLSFPATIQLKVDGTNIQTITVNNSQHAIDTTNYMYRVAEKQIASKELNKLLPLENEKKEIAKRVLDNKGQYKQIKILGQDYYLNDKAEYDKAKLEYDRIKAKYDFKNNLLNGYKNLISNYGTGIDNVNTTNAQVTEKSEGVKAIEVSDKETFVALGGKEAIKQQKQQELKLKVGLKIKKLKISYTSPYKTDTTKHFINYPYLYEEHKNGHSTVLKNRNGKVIRGSQILKDYNSFNKYPFTIYIEFNNNGTGYDFPAKVWAVYKIDSSDEYTEYTEYTEYVDINSRQDLKNGGVLDKVINSVCADIDLRRLNRVSINSTKKESPVTDALKLSITDLVKKLDKLYNTQDKNSLVEYINNYIKNKVEIIYTEAQFGGGFAVGYGKAIYDTADYIHSLNFQKLKSLLGNIWNTLSDSTEYGLNISKYWSTMISYNTNNNPSDLQKLNDLEKKLSFAPEIIYAKNLLTSIDWDRFEDKSYWIGYYTGYLAENVLVSKGVGAGTSFANKLLKISNLSKKLKNAGVIGSYTSLEKVGILQDKLIKEAKKWNVVDIQTIANKTNNPTLIYNQFDNGEIYEIIKKGNDTLFLAKGNSANGFEHIFITGRDGKNNLTRYEQLHKNKDVKLNDWLKKEYGYEIDSPDNMMRFIKDVTKNGKKSTVNKYSYELNVYDDKSRIIEVGIQSNGYINTIKYK